MEPIFRRDRDGWTLRIDWRITVPIFVVLFSLCTDARAEVPCPPCTGFDVDMALAAEDGVACMPITEPGSETYIEFEILWDDGTLKTQIADVACTVTFPLYVDNPVRTRGRRCNNLSCTAYGKWSHSMRMLETYCPGDLDGSGEVDGADFILFRAHFGDICL